jgi:acetyl-CoA carboxylase biotin carboxylase subunit
VNLRYLAAALDHPAFRAGEYDTAFCTRFAKDLLPKLDPKYEGVALIAAAVAAFKRDHDQAEAHAARAGQAGAARSNWLRIGRARALRGGVR